MTRAFVGGTNISTRYPLFLILLIARLLKRWEPVSMTFFSEQVVFG